MTETTRLGRPPTGRDTVQITCKILRENRDWLRDQPGNPGATLDRIITDYRNRQETEMTRTNWKDLIVFDNEGNNNGTLGEMVNSAPANLDNAVIEDGRITEWQDWFLGAPTDTPEGDGYDEYVPEADWTGFEDALAPARGLA